MKLVFPKQFARKDVKSNKSIIDVSGNGEGNISINGRNIFLANNSQLISGNSEQENSSKPGEIVLNAEDTISLDRSFAVNNVGSSNKTSASGNIGNILLEARVVSLTNGAQLQAGLFGGARGKTPGTISVKAQNSVLLDGENTGIAANADPGAVGDGSNVEISGNSVTLRNGSKITASNAGQGNAGNITVVAKNLFSLDKSLIFSNIGNPEGGVSSMGRVGNIRIEANTVSLTNGGQLQAGLSPQAVGEAGSISVKAQDSVIFEGKGSGIFTNVDVGAIGNGSDIQIAARSVRFSNGSGLTAGNAGTGNAGNININSPDLRLDTNSGILARSATGNGGNIVLDIPDLLILRRNGQISTTAGTAQAGGDGGNITITTPFILSAPLENSDITANAFSGNGGRVDIKTQKIFWLEPRSRAELGKLLRTNIPEQLNPARLSTNDITAISQTNPNLSGQVGIDAPDVDPSRGLVPLPLNLVDPSDRIDQSCIPGVRQSASSFTATGRGGLPPSPTEPLGNAPASASWVALNANPKTFPNQTIATHSSDRPPQTSSPPERIIEAQGWTVDANGEVNLVAQVPTAVPHNPAFVPVSCR